MAGVRLRQNPSAIADFLRLDSVVWAHIDSIIKETAEYGRSIAPVLTGDYKDSIKTRMVHNPTRMKGQVYSRDWKVFIVEFGARNVATGATFAKMTAFMLEKGVKFSGPPGFHEEEDDSEEPD